MPHNNRMSTSATLMTSDIWSKTIGHNPHASTAEKQETVNTEADAEKARSVMEMARNQNVTDGANRDDFTMRMFLGLKKGKQRRADSQQTSQTGAADLKLDDPSSSSEEEFVAPETLRASASSSVAKKKSSKDSRKKKHSKRKRQSSKPSDDDGDSSSSSGESSHRERKRRSKESKKKKHRNHSSRDYSDDSSDDERRHRRKEKRQRRDDRKPRGDGEKSTKDSDRKSSKR
jgi:transcription termination factor Rho